MIGSEIQLILSNNFLLWTCIILLLAGVLYDVSCIVIIQKLNPSFQESMECVKVVTVFLFWFFIMDHNSLRTRMDYQLFILLCCAQIVILLGVVLVTETKDFKIFGFDDRFGEYNNSANREFSQSDFGFLQS